MIRALCLFVLLVYRRRPSQVAQLAQARVQRDEAVAAEAAVTVKMLDLKARELRHREGDCVKDGVIASLLAQIEEMKQQQHLTQSVNIDALKGDVIDDLNGQNQQLQLLLQQQQQQQHLLISQHDQQRSLLQRSCSELQAELLLLQAALNDSRSEAELLRARVAEVEVSIACPLFLSFGRPQCGNRPRDAIPGCVR